MTQEIPDWLAEELGFPVLVEKPDGQCVANGPADAALKGEMPADLASAITRIIKTPFDSGQLNHAIEAARQGRRTAISPCPGQRLLIFQNADGGASAMIAGVDGALAESIQARATAADLAAGVSHEVSNALSAIIGWAQVAQERPDKAPPNEALSLIERSAQNARGAAQDLLRMVRREDNENACTDMGVVIENVVRLLRPEAQKKHIRVTTDATKDCWIGATRSQLFSIVWNLAHNAVQIIPNGGIVHLSCRQKSDLVELEVHDNGPGMSPEQRDKAFDAYFTTRDGGTGLGLSIVRGTVDSLGGRIRLDTSPGDGAQFRIQLPGLEKQRDSGSVPKPNRIGLVLDDTDTSGAHVLIVEDDEGVRGLIATTLELCSIDATCVASLEEARAIDAEFTVAMIDLTLPDGRGDSLLAELRKKHRVKVAAIMSGGPPPADLVNGGKPDRWMRKPFDPADLLLCVRELIERAQIQPARTANQGSP